MSARALAAVGLAVAALAACAPESGGDGSGDSDGDGNSDGGGGVDGGAFGFVDAGDIDTPPDPGPACNELRAVVRDFKAGHPDFETFTADGVFPGLVLPVLGVDGTPTYAHAGATPHTAGPASFADWYHDVPGVNQKVTATLALVETTPDLYVYDSAAFFPVDGQGFGNLGNPHNFHFTTQIHTSFTYEGGEEFTFRGDDDLWLFIAGHLVIDLGGLHQPASATIDLDALAPTLGLTVGATVAMDIFHAERHTTASNFRIETTIRCLVVE